LSFYWVAGAKASGFVDDIITLLTLCNNSSILKLLSPYRLIKKPKNNRNINIILR
jgi:hypothetical protein